MPGDEGVHVAKEYLMANALDTYYSDHWREIGWMPNAEGAISKDIQKALDGDRNDPATWVAFAAKTMQTVWQSLPDDMRQAAQVALGDLIQLGLQNVGTLATNAIASAGSSIGNVIPLIGAIIEGLIVMIQGFVKLAKEVESDREDTAAGHYMDSTRWTVQRHEHPSSWIVKKSRVINYLDRYDGKWRLRPSFTRSGGASDLMFSDTKGAGDKGGCGIGIWMKCGTKSFVTSADCHKRYDHDVACTRYLMISALFYPFWSPAYPDKTSVEEQARRTGGWGETGGKKIYTPVTANSILISRQMALLTSPSVNFRAGEKRLLRARDQFREWFFRMSNAFAPDRAGQAPKPEFFGVLPIGHNHIMQRVPMDERLSIDWNAEPDLPPAKAQNQFYFDDDGLIQAYTDADVTKWGIVARPGPHTPKDAAISIAQYNTVMSATLAFMSARANFLRNGPMMKKLLADFDLKDFDDEVQSAMEYSASVGKMLPPPSRARPSPKKADAKELVKPKRAGPRRMQRDDEGAGVAVLGAAAVAGLLAYLKWGRG